MDRRSLTETVARNVRSAAAALGTSPETLAQATDIQLPVMNDRLNAVTPFTIPELLSVGGFFRIPVDQFLMESAA
jgi:hypothetical protein